MFVLKGKPLNVWDLKRDVMYKNDEMYNLMQALSVEDTTESLRYEKVILATDADVNWHAHPQPDDHLFLQVLRTTRP